MSLRRFAVAAAMLFCFSFPGHAQETVGWQANPLSVARSTRQQPNFNFDEARVPIYQLPNLLGKTRTSEAWQRRRRLEILELFGEYVYGRSPGRPEQLQFQLIEENTRAMNGAATLKRIAVISRQKDRRHKFEITIFLPNSLKNPAPLFLLLNNRPVSNTDSTRMDTQNNNSRMSVFAN